MKIFEVSFSLAQGGAERFVVDLSNELSKDNTVILLTLKDDKVDSNTRNFYKEEVNGSVQYVNLGLAGGFHLQSLWKIYKFIKNESPDIVHLNGQRVPYFCILAIILLHNITFIQTIHSDIKCYKDLFYQFFASSFGTKIFKYHFVALSKKNYEDWKKAFPRANSHLVFNGRSPLCRTTLYDEVTNLVHSYNKESLLFIHVARFSEVKNQQLLVRSFNKIVSEGYNVQLIILGEGFETPDGKKLQSMACPNIHFLGPHNNIADYLCSSDIFCLSSNHEGLPISILEAQLSGLPIVSTPVCGALDVVEDKKNGVISKDFSEEAYVNALKYAIENLDFLTENARELMTHSPYTMKKCAQEYQEVYHNITKNKAEVDK